MSDKIPKSFKFSPTIVHLIERLSELEYGNATRVIEMLVWRESEARGLLKPGNGKHNPCNEPAKRRRSRARAGKGSST